MPNDRIDPSLAQALGNAFGGRPAAPVPQQPTATPPSSEGSGVASSLWNALMNRNEAAAQPVNPYENLANKATGKSYR